MNKYTKLGNLIQVKFQDKRNLKFVFREKQSQSHIYCNCKQVKEKHEDLNDKDKKEIIQSIQNEIDLIEKEIELIKYLKDNQIKCYTDETNKNTTQCYDEINIPHLSYPDPTDESIKTHLEALRELAREYKIQPPQPLALATERQNHINEIAHYTFPLEMINRYIKNNNPNQYHNLSFDELLKQKEELEDLVIKLKYSLQKEISVENGLVDTAIKKFSTTEILLFSAIINLTKDNIKNTHTIKLSNIYKEMGMKQQNKKGYQLKEKKKVQAILEEKSIFKSFIKESEIENKRYARIKLSEDTIVKDIKKGNFFLHNHSKLLKICKINKSKIGIGWKLFLYLQALLSRDQEKLIKLETIVEKLKLEKQYKINPARTKDTIDKALDDIIQTGLLAGYKKSNNNMYTLYNGRTNIVELTKTETQQEDIA